MYEYKLSVIIVNFNGGGLLLDAVMALLSDPIPIQVIVSDNGSTDNSLELLEKHISNDHLLIHQNKKNIGFAAGINRVIALADGDYLLFLNPDSIVENRTLEEMLSVMELYPSVGMSGCLIRNLDGSEQAGARRRVPTPARSLVRALGLDIIFPILKEKGILLHQFPLPRNIEEVEAISGAFMLVRREAMEDVGVMDEGYFLHCEDLDWCMRFRIQGWKILFVPQVSVVHQQGTCSSSRPVRVEWHKHKGMVRFYRKFFKHQYPYWLMGGVIASVWFRFVLVSVLLTVKRLHQHTRRA